MATMAMPLEKGSAKTNVMRSAAETNVVAKGSQG